MSLQAIELPVDDAGERTALHALMRELRPRLTEADFDELMTEGPAHGLRVLAVRDDHGHLVGAALYRVLVTSRGRLLFVDDLVTTAASRSAGIGSVLFEELERRGRAAGCVRLELDSGTTNQAAHRFYHRQRMGVIALHFAKDLDR